MPICCPSDEQSSFRLHLGYCFFLMSSIQQISCAFPFCKMAWIKSIEILWVILPNVPTHLSLSFPPCWSIKFDQSTRQIISLFTFLFTWCITQILMLQFPFNILEKSFITRGCYVTYYDFLGAYQLARYYFCMKSFILQVPAFAFDKSNFSLWGSGEWWMLLAAQSMAVGTVMVRWVSKYSDPVMATGLVGCIIICCNLLVTLWIQQFIPALLIYLWEIDL